MSIWRVESFKNEEVLSEIRSGNEDFVLAPPCLLSQRSKGGNASTGTSQCRYFTFQLTIHIGLLPVSVWPSHDGKEGGSVSVLDLRF
jgi:hypothetical protein